MEGRYRINIIESEMEVRELMETYYNRMYFQELCARCPNYGRLWSCPPYDFPPEDYLKQYRRLTVVGTQIVLSADLRDQVFTKEAMEEAMEEILWDVKAVRDRQLLSAEKEAPGRRMLSSGGCRLCSRCAREVGMPCGQQGRMRYSLESLGCDVTRISADKLGLPLLWAEDRLPEYFVLVNGMLHME